jgi:putative transposase
MNKLRLTPGSLTRCRDRDAIILDFVDLETVLVEFDDDLSIHPVRISELKPAELSSDSPAGQRLTRLSEVALPLITDNRWLAARERLDSLRELLLQPKHARSQALVDAAAARLNKSRATVYRWLERYEASGSIRALMRLDRTDRGKPRIQADLEGIITEAIEKEYLQEKKSPATVVEEIRKYCFQNQIVPPHPSTILRRIASINPQTVSSRREGKKIFKEKYGLQRGQYPEVGYPLAHGQIDHSPADYCLVDEVHRKPLDGSPTFTICIDVKTRCILGFSLSLEAPSIRLAGECIVNSALRKEALLSELEINADWPCYGIPSVILTDNASEFEAPDFIRACNEWGAEVRKRPKGAPNYAGLVESTFRTYLHKIHELEGGRQPGKGQRSMAYDIKGRPVMTLREFRRWMTIFITKYYHQQPHSGLMDLPPIEAWRRGILGFGDQIGIGLPDQVTNEFKLRVDFLPSVPRTVQTYGVRFAHHDYTGDVLRQWVGAKDPENPKLARQFVIKYDPWDITEIYFLDPIIGRYYPLISSSKMEHMTLWECEATSRSTRRENRGTVDEHTIYEGMDEMRQQTAVAAKSTRKARREQQRRLDSGEFSVKARRQKSAASPLAEMAAISDDDDGPLLPMSGTVEAEAPETQGI